MKILGLSAYYHDSSACLIVDGQVVAACQEERLSRIKHDASFPEKSIRYCLQQAQCQPTDIDAIVFFEKPFLKFERLLETYLAFAPRGFISFIKALPLWLNEKLFQKKLLSDELSRLEFNKDQCRKILFSSHHLSHAASAFYASPFSESLVLTMDGVGEWDTTTVYHGKGSNLNKIYGLKFPHSLGLLYSAFTYYCGFKVNSGEYKLMGLAPYGRPTYVELIKKHLIDIKEDGSFKLNLDYFDYCTGLTMTNQKFNFLFDLNQRQPESKIEQCHMDLAASIQQVLEEVVINICTHMRSELNIRYLCLAGGVALNCVANGKIKKLGLFDDIWVQPAAGDSGGALGAALAAYHLHFNKPRIPAWPDLMQGSYLGPQYNEIQIEEFLILKNAQYIKLSNEVLLEFISQKLVDEQVVGWFNGRMEFGPRALGNRSILADARSPKMQKILNLKIKFRESFRPFAPAILDDQVQNWFDYKDASPYMLMVAPVIKEKQIRYDNYERAQGFDLMNDPLSKIPAVTHVDYSARLQTVSESTNSRFYNLIKSFYNKTGVPVLINTSFNIRNEPIVCTPADAYKCFMGTNMDILVLENYVLLKENQPEKNKQDYQHLFEMD